jgi:CelD/BcsL family acetyltransferase involved in cellulose biosynthesis
VKIVVARPHELGPNEQRLWEDMRSDNPHLANPFLSYGFSRAVSLARKSARVGVVYEGEQIVGFFPFEAGRAGAGRAIGTGINDCQGVIRARDASVDPAALIKHAGLRTWSFDHLQAEQVEFQPMHRSLHASPIIDVSRGFEAYVDDRRRVSKSLIKSIELKKRRLVRDVGPVDVVFESRSAEHLDQVLAWKREQYARTNAPDVFEQGWVREVLDTLFSQDQPGCRVVLSLLQAGGEPVAGHVGLCSSSVMASWFPAYDARRSYYSPGLLLALGYIEGAARSHLRYIDLGRGDADYKDRLKTAELFVAKGMVGDGSLRARARVTRARAAESAGEWTRSQLQQHPQARRAVRRLRRTAANVRARST